MRYDWLGWLLGFIVFLLLLFYVIVPLIHHAH